MSANKLCTNKELIRYEVKDQFILKSIDIYKEELFEEYIDIYKKKLIVILSKDFNNPNKPKYLNHIFNDSQIYNEPISGYFVHKADTILIYSKKDKYINPWKYSSAFSAKMKQQLNDTESLYKNDDLGWLVFKDSYITNHSLYWKVHKNKIIKECKNFNALKLLYGTKNNWGCDYDGKGDSLSLKISKYK